MLRWSYRQLAIPDDPDLYYDPYTTHYTGTQNILKGWCAAIRWADKLINSDYIHTASGHSIYFECTDNFADLRGRFFPLIERLRASLQWSLRRILTLIVDRCIYSNDVFKIFPTKFLGIAERMANLRFEKFPDETESMISCEGTPF